MWCTHIVCVQNELAPSREETVSCAGQNDLPTTWRLYPHVLCARGRTRKFIHLHPRRNTATVEDRRGNPFSHTNTEDEEEEEEPGNQVLHIQSEVSSLLRWNAWAASAPSCTQLRTWDSRPLDWRYAGETLLNSQICILEFDRGRHTNEKQVPPTGFATGHKRSCHGVNT